MCIWCILYNQITLSTYFYNNYCQQLSFLNLPIVFVFCLLFFFMCIFDAAFPFIICIVLNFGFCNTLVYLFLFVRYLLGNVFLILSPNNNVLNLIQSHLYLFKTYLYHKRCSGLTCRTLSEFGVSGLHHPAEAVRKVAERILVLVYKVNPRLVRKQLPPDDDITRRNLLYRQLFHEFDKIDLQVMKKAIFLQPNTTISFKKLATKHYIGNTTIIF